MTELEGKLALALETLGKQYGEDINHLSKQILKLKAQLDIQNSASSMQNQRLIEHVLKLTGLVNNLNSRLTNWTDS